MTKVLPSVFFCECGRCDEKIPYSDELWLDFLDYCDQRDNYVLIAKTCPYREEIDPRMIAVDGKGYWIVESDE